MNKNEKGQTLVVIFFVMVIALTIGVGISNRFITSLRISTRVYTSYRAQSVAEAALENILLRSNSELEDYINFGSCGSDCLLTIVNADGLTETATITLSFLGNTSDPYKINLRTDKTAEVSMLNYGDALDVTICWDGVPISPSPSVFGMLIYGDQGNYQVSNFANNTAGSIQTNGFAEATGGSGFDSCFNVNSQTNPRFLRLRSIYSDVEVTIIPDPTTTIASQGILIESVGQVLDTTKKISVIKGNNLLPMPFDYLLYSKSETDPLSN